jgi:hypothetical protein
MQADIQSGVIACSTPGNLQDQQGAMRIRADVIAEVSR